MTFLAPTWGEERACLGIPTELFFIEDPVESVQINRSLRRVCAACPALVECRDWARRHEAYGFWGGESAKARAEWRRANKVSMQRIGVDGKWITRGGYAA